MPHPGEIDFRLDLFNDDGEQVTRRLRCNAKLTPKTRTWKFLENILGRTISVGDSIDLDEVIDKPCRIEIENKVSPATLTRWANIVAVHPATSHPNGTAEQAEMTLPPTQQAPE